MQRHYLNIAHRGASAYEPENTLRAFRRAIELGADMSELDLHLSQDGALIVMHDYTVEKTTDGRGEIKNLSLAQIKELDAGKGERVPTLQDVIDLVNDQKTPHGVRVPNRFELSNTQTLSRDENFCGRSLVRGRNGLYLELKAEGTPRATAHTLRANEFTARENVIVGSFQAALVRETKTLAPELSTSLLVGPVYPARELIVMARDARADYIHLCWENRAAHPHELLTPELLRALHEAGLGIVLWHEERDDELRVLRTLDVDAICTNAPDKL